jgi:hypothetical protein
MQDQLLSGRLAATFASGRGFAAGEPRSPERIRGMQQKDRMEAWTLVVCLGLALIGALGAAANRVKLS